MHNKGYPSTFCVTMFVVVLNSKIYLSNATLVLDKFTDVESQGVT